MCLKEDYYSGLGSQMHAAYNTQIVVCRGIIVFYYLSQDRSDTRTLIPTLEGFKSMYGCYPKRICADAGYGSFANYKYCNTKGIEAFIKYPSWNGERTGRYPAVYEYLEDGTVSCLGGRTGNRVEIPNRHPKTQQSAFYKVENCTNCQFMAYCRRFMKDKEGNERIFEVMPEYVTLKQGARDRLLRPEGIEMRVNRSYQVEGTFGVLKQNMAYTRFRRRKLAKVRLEFALTCLGLNIRKFLKFKISGTPVVVKHFRIKFFFSLAKQDLFPYFFGCLGILFEVKCVCCCIQKRPIYQSLQAVSRTSIDSIFLP